MRRLIATAERAQQKELSQDEKRTLWNTQLSHDELTALQRLKMILGPIRQTE